MGIFDVLVCPISAWYLAEARCLRRDPHEMQNLAADDAYENVKRQMARRMWRFAHSESDTMVSTYCTVALAPYGPAEAFRGDD
jgi:hypothetical protein